MHTDDTPTGQPPRTRPVPVPVALLLVCLLSPVSCLLLTGCRPNKRYDLIEAELRTRDRELAETRAALEQSRILNRAFEQQLGHAQPPGRAPHAIHPTAAGGGLYVRDIQLARGTGGVDDDSTPGDEALMVVIVPRDEDGSAVKVPGRAQVAAWEILPSGLKNPIGNWDVPAEKLRPTWRSGLFSTGYFVPLPWQTFPTTERVRVAVRLTTTDGRSFEADRDVTVRPMVHPVPPGSVLPYPTAPPVPAPPPTPYPSTPVVPSPQPGGREPLLPSTPPPGVPPVLPPGTEELPPPAGLQPERGARLLPPVRE
jgi:hypothetical protein